MSVRRRRIKQRVERNRRWKEAMRKSDKCLTQVRAAIQKHQELERQGVPFDREKFLLDAFGA